MTNNRFIRSCLTITLSAVIALTFGASGSFAAEAPSIGDADVPAAHKAEDVRNCVDISEWNGKLTTEDFRAMKEANVQSIIIRAGYSTLDTNTGKEDSMFKHNIELAQKEDLDIGVYYYSSALTEEEAVTEAKTFLEIIEPYRDLITLPAAMDFETNKKGRLTHAVLKEMGPEKATALCCAFCDTVQEAGYVPMLYASRSVLEHNVDAKVLEERYPIWLAQYTNGLTATGYEGKYMIWQYSSKVRIDGLEKRIDANYLFSEKEEKQEEGEVYSIMESAGMKAEDDAIESEGQKEPDKAAGDQSAPEKESADPAASGKNAAEESQGEENRSSSPALTEKMQKNSSESRQEETSEKKPQKKTATFNTHNSKAGVPIRSDGEYAEARVLDTDGFSHHYRVEKTGAASDGEAVLAAALSGFFTGGGKAVSPQYVHDRLLPAVIGDARTLTLRDFGEVFSKLGLSFELAEKPDDRVYLKIKESLAKGYPVVMHISPQNRKWGGSQFLLLIGMDESGKAIAADTRNRKWSSEDQRFKILSVDELVPYLGQGYITLIRKN